MRSDVVFFSTVIGMALAAGFSQLFQDQRRVVSAIPTEVRAIRVVENQNWRGPWNYCRRVPLLRVAVEALAGRTAPVS